MIAFLLLSQNIIEEERREREREGGGERGDFLNHSFAQVSTNRADTPFPYESSLAFIRRGMDDMPSPPNEPPPLCTLPKRMLSQSFASSLTVFSDGT
jgi:hypothetical protein